MRRREVDFAGCVAPAAGGVRADRGERLIDLPELHVLRHRDRVSSQAARREFRSQIHQLLGFGIAERAQDYPVDDREDGGVRADPQRQRE